MEQRRDVSPIMASQFPTGAPAPAKIAVIGNFPPSRCGIASFTFDMMESLLALSPMTQIDVYPMSPRGDAVAFDAPVRQAIIKDEPESYRAAAAAIEASDVDLIWLQHEFGLFGDSAGRMIFELLDRASAPLVVTLHTVLESPDDNQRYVMERLCERASRLVVMCEQGQRILCESYGIKPEQIALIPHGVPDRPLARDEAMKRKFDLLGHDVMLTFGLLSRGKGIETVIEALPTITRLNPDVRYVIAGATHPNLIASEGEAYRDSLKAKAQELGVAGYIQWIDRFMPDAELLDLIEAAEIYLTPYNGAAQSTSGTLAYAFALGKAVISTPYVHACELLKDGHGVLVPFGDAVAIADAVCSLLKDRNSLHALQRRAWLKARNMTWPHFARASFEVIAQVKSRPHTRLLQVPLIATPAGAMRLVDDVGMAQHSIFSIPDRRHGYCIDDNCRALILANRSQGRFADCVETFAAFVQHAWNPDRGVFRNFMAFDRRWLEEAGSEDSNGRTLWSLGATIAEGRNASLRLWAETLFEEAAVMVSAWTSPRAMAFAVLGADLALSARPHSPTAWHVLTQGAQRLSAFFERVSKADWCWFESVLAYDNARLAEALIRAGERLKDAQMTAHGLEALKWLDARQTAPAGHFRPVGSRGFGLSELPPLPFDQQPVDAWATIDAADAAFDATHDRQWVDVAHRAFAWFFGANDRGVSVAKVETGSCFDGITPTGTNMNEGAESVLAFHLANRTMRLLINKDDEDRRVKEDKTGPLTA